MSKLTKDCFVYTYKGLLILLSMISLTEKGRAQSQIRFLTPAAEADANKLVQAYASPYLKRHADGWADGWTYTSTHERLTFNLVSASATFINNNEKTFDASALKLDGNITIVGSPVNQTAAGASNTTGAGFDIHSINPAYGDRIVAHLEGPRGLNIHFRSRSFVPTIVTPQIGFGISPTTELMIRFLPDFKVNNHTYASAYGVGIKKTLTDLIFGPRNKIFNVPPPVELAAYAGYSMETLFYNLHINPSAGTTPGTGSENASFSHQKIRIHSNDLTVGALASKKIYFLTAHAGLAFTASNTSLSLKGNYPVIAEGSFKTSYITNPFNVSGANTGVSANIGVNLNVWKIRVNTDIIAGRYTRFNIGLGISL